MTTGNRIDIIGQNGNDGEHYDMKAHTPPFDTVGPKVQKEAKDCQVGGEHYKAFAIQPYEYCYKNNLNNLQSEAISYITRYNKKWFTTDKQTQDIKKAIHTLELLLGEIEGSS